MPYCLAKDEVCFVGEPVAIVVAESRYLAEDAAAQVDVDYEVLPVVSDPAKGLAPGRAAGAPGLAQQPRRLHPGQCRRHRRGLRAGGACVPRENLPAPRRPVLHRMPRDDRGAGRGHRRADDLRVLAGAAPAQAGSARSHGLGGPSVAHRHARRRRRLRPEGQLLCRIRRACRRGAGAAPAGEMDRGPAREFPLHPAGARPVLGHGDRGRPRREDPRRARHARPRRRRLHAVGRGAAVDRGDLGAGAVRHPGASSSTCRSSSPTRCRPRRCAAPAARKPPSPWSG